MAEEKKPKKPRGKAELIDGKCIACGARCESSCPSDAIEMAENGEPIIDVEKCIGCRKCVKVCPAEALRIYYTPEEQKILDELLSQQGEEAVSEEDDLTAEEIEAREKIKAYRGVWVFVEQTYGKPAQVSWELLGVGSELAQSRGVELSAVIIGNDVEALCQEAFAHGASKVYLMDAPLYKDYRTRPYYQSVCYLVQKYQPEIVLFGATVLGRDLAGAVATKLETGLTADCTGLDVDEHGFLLQTRPAFGGNIMATIVTELTRPQMATVRPHVMPLPERNDKANGEVVYEEVVLNEEDFTTRVLEIIEDQQGTEIIDIASAHVLVSGGRGMCGPENFTILHELAEELGGTVSCSKAVVEAGWLPATQQVGQTGKTVRPKIYIACGISGAIQHLVGMQDSDVIIAINRDPLAPIFEVASYGIVGDALDIVPRITERIRELRSNN